MRLRPALAALLLVTPAAAVEGGAEDRATTHAVAIATGGPAEPALRCSGTLIAPNVVLTVRHCLSRLLDDVRSCDQSFSPPPGAAGDFWINPTPWTLPGADWKKVARWVLPQQIAVCGNDVALLVLEREVLPSEATPARPALTEAEFRAAVGARVFGLAGFGATNAAGAGGGTRRSRFDVPVQCVPGDLSFACDGALDYVDVREFSGGGGPCSGDSGGGAIARSDRDLVFGVLSRGDLSAGTCSEGVYERTDVWGWLVAKTVLEATPAGESPPAWARAAFPEPPRVGDRCRGAGSCSGDAECVSFDGERSFTCAARCSAGCAAGTRCESDVCAPDSAHAAPPDGGGCSASPSHAPSTLSVTALLLFATLRGRRDRARASSCRRR